MAQLKSLSLFILQNFKSQEQQVKEKIEYFDRIARASLAMQKCQVMYQIGCHVPHRRGGPVPRPHSRRVFFLRW